MLKQFVTCMGVALFTMIAPLAAQLVEQGTTVESRRLVSQVSPALMTEIVYWLSSNFELPPIYDPPGIAFVPEQALVSLRYKLSLSRAGDRRNTDMYPPAVLDLIAIYDDQATTIYISEAWIGNTSAEMSILVHEMVHHLQNLGRLKYECPAAREKLAYLAQNEWLKRSGP